MIRILITMIFFIQALIFAALQWVIYFRVERTTLNVKSERKKQ